MKKLFAILALSLCMSGCVNVPRYDLPLAITQENLLVRCPETLPALTGGSGGAILVTMESWSGQYMTCKEIHNALVEAIRQQQKAVQQK